MFRLLSTFKQTPWCRRLVWAVAAFVAYVVIGFFALPPIIKWQLLKRLPALTKRQAEVARVRFNPLALSLTIRGLALKESDGRTFASWEELYVNFQASSLFRRAWTFDEIRLVKPFGEFILLPSGRLNFANLLEGATNTTASAPPPKPGALPRLNVFHLLITNAFVAIEDRTRASTFRAEYRPINLRLEHLTTLPNLEAPYSFKAEGGAGGVVAWEGDVTLQPFSSSGQFQLTGLRLSPFQPYLAPFTRALLTNGVVAVHCNYSVEASTNGLEAVVTNATMRLDQFALVDPRTGETVVGLGGLDVTDARFDLRQNTARVGAVKLSEASLLARLEPGGTLNLLELVKPSPAGTPAASTNVSAATTSAKTPLTVEVNAVSLENASIQFEDLTHAAPFKTDLKPIRLEVKGLTTRPGADAEYRFSLATEVAETIEATGRFSINPVRSSGEIHVGAVELKKYLPYVQDQFRGRLTSGRLETRIPYEVALATNRVLAAVTNLAVQVTELEVVPAGTKEPVLKLDRLSLEQVDASLERRRARAGLLKVEGGSVMVRRARDGSLNLLSLLPVSPPKTPTKPAPALASGPTLDGALPAGAAGWSANLRELTLNRCRLRFEDQVPEPQAVFIVDQLSAKVNGLSADPGAPITASVSLRLNESGTVVAQTTAQLAPLSAETDLALTNVDLRAAQPYLDPFVSLNLASGALRVTGHAAFHSQTSSVPRFAFKGSVGLTNLLVTDQVQSRELGSWGDLEVSGIDFTAQPNRLGMEEIKFTRLHGNVVLGSDRRPNFAAILKTPATTGTSLPAPTVTPPLAAGGPEPLAEAFPVEVGALVLDRASLSFSDESITPHAGSEVAELSGTIKGLSASREAMAEVNLGGQLNGQSPFGISGKARPLGSRLFVDLLITNANTQLTPLTGYLEKYAGHPLAKGRLTTSLHYHIDGQELDARNQVRIDQLTLGPRNQSPDATKLPVKLGVALLKDSHGAIDLDIPVKGRLDDPAFSVGPIVLKVIVNLLTKAATSPFKLLGALVGGGEELSFVEFAAGSTNVPAAEMDKLGKLAKALANRPTLSVEIDAGIDPVNDRDSLSLEKLRERLKHERVSELRARGQAPTLAAAFVVDSENYDRLLRAAFAAEFGTNISTIIRTNQAALPKPKGPPPGFVKGTLHRAVELGDRAISIVGLGDFAKKSKAEQHLTRVDRIALNQATPALMERLLADRIPVSNEDYHKLMEARGRWVQDWLAQNGGVTADRMLLVAPKTVDSAYQGQARVNLTLD